MRRAKREAGFSLIEVMVCSVILAIVLFAAASSVTSTNKILKEIVGTESAVETGNLVIAPIASAPRYEIERLCTNLGVWKPKTWNEIDATSRCDSLDFTTAPSESKSITAAEGLPPFADALGIDLRSLRMDFAQRLYCVDLVACRRALSDAVIELRFDYAFAGGREGSIVRRTIRVRTGSRG